MSNSVYAALTRQVGLLNEMQAVANNIANISTTGYRKEGLVFAEHVTALEGPSGSLSLATTGPRVTFETEGAFRNTGGTFDLAIQGNGYFQISTPEGPRLTRAGTFSMAADSTLVTPDGHPVLDVGGSPVFIPTDIGAIGIAQDGTISAGGDPVGQVGIFEPDNPLSLRREDGVRFAFEGQAVAAPNGRVMQGFVEGSNVDPVSEIARMIEVQRAYELGQSFLEQEDKRIGSVISSVGRS